MAFVKKRDGRSESFDVEKLKKVISWATEGLDVNPLQLESKFDEFLTDDITTDTIQNNLIYHSRILCTPDDLEWTIVAGRLETMRHWKSTAIGEKTFQYYIKEQIDKGVYKHPAIKKWTKNEIIKLGNEIVQEKDLEHSYGSILTASKKYLLPNECIQQMHMTNAMIIASLESREERLEWATKIYHALSDRKISLATPWLSNLRANSNISSCFIIQVEDDIDSIFDNVKNSALISKLGGGLGVDMSLIRAYGSEINGVKDASRGIPSWTKLFNDTAVCVDQGGKRAGAFTIHTPIWHRDIEDFLAIQLENKDPRLQSFDIFPQVGIYDNFMREVLKEDGGIWHTFCPYEVEKVMGFKISGVFGKEFTSKYRKCVNAFNNDKLENVGVYNAKALLIELMKSQVETGMPYVAFLDRINEVNPNNHDGYIPCVNLCTESFSNVKADELTHTCVVGNTKIITDVGLQNIKDCQDKNILSLYEADVYNKTTHKFVNGNVIYQGKRDTYEVIMTSGESIKCTDNHKFLTPSGNYVELKELAENDTLVNIKHFNLDYNKPEFNNELQSLGWMFGDGWMLENTIGVCFGEDDKNAKDIVIPTLNNILESKCSSYKDVPKEYVDKNNVITWATKTKSFLSYFYEKYDIMPSLGKYKRFSDYIMTLPKDDISNILSGLFSADGCVVDVKNDKNPAYIAYTSASEKLLKDIQILLTQFGIKSSYHFYKVSGRDTSQGSLTIKNTNAQKFIDMIGFSLTPWKNNKWEKVKSVDIQDRYNKNTVKIKSIKYIGLDDVYDISLPERHNYVSNGLISRNCNLASVVVGRIHSDEEMVKMARICTRILDNGIELTHTPIKSAKAHNTRYRTIGVGIQGLHDYIAKNNYTWKSYKEITKLAELIEYGCVKESIHLAKTREAYPQFKGSQWDSGVLMDNFIKHSVTDLDWNGLKQDMSKYGIRNSQLTSPAPNTSTATFMDASAGCIPVYSAFYNEDNACGKFTVYGMYLKENPLSYENTAPRQNQVELTKVVGALQKFVDTGVSFDYIYDHNQGFTAKDLYDTIVGAWKNKTKAIYYIRSIKQGNTIDDVIGIESVCVGCSG